MAVAKLGRAPLRECRGLVAGAQVVLASQRAAFSATAAAYKGSKTHASMAVDTAVRFF